MSASQNARDREHLARVRAAAPKLLEACVAARDYLVWLADDSYAPRCARVQEQLTAAIAATQPPAKRKGRK